jgi:hypothetical protein
VVLTEALLPIAVLAGLQARGVAVEQAQRAGQVQILAAREAYLSAGRFESPRALDALVGHIDQAYAEGHRGLRLVGDNAWTLDELAGVDGLAGYEAQVNQLYMDGRALGVCLDDRRAIDAALLWQVTGAHPATTAATGWAPLLRIRRTTTPYGLRLVGEADITNRQAVGGGLGRRA